MNKKQSFTIATDIFPSLVPMQMAAVHASEDGVLILTAYDKPYSMVVYGERDLALIKTAILMIEERRRGH